MVLKYSPEIQVVLPGESRQVILEHCRQTLEAFRDGRTKECKAFGLLCGTVSDQTVTVAECFPLTKNVRSLPPYKEHMDRVMAEHAIPSLTPLDQRGWVADPAELFARIRECRSNQHLLVGTYHMHRVGWEHDRERDTPTRLDAVLAKESGMLMFIVSMVDPVRPIIRAFYEGIMEKEMLIQ